MVRIVLALLFVFAVAAQTASLGANQDGLRLPAFTSQSTRLTEYAEFDDADHHLLFLGASIVRAIPALERLEPLAFRQNLHRSQHVDNAGVPLYEFYAVWRI
jgi:hypothetical protein